MIIIMIIIMIITIIIIKSTNIFPISTIYFQSYRRKYLSFFFLLLLFADDYNMGGSMHSSDRELSILKGQSKVNSTLERIQQSRK